MTEPERMSAEELSEALLVLDGDASFGSDVWRASQSVRAYIAALEAELAEARAQEREACAAWHDERARDTPDAFEMEFHQVSAAAIRARKEG